MEIEDLIKKERKKAKITQKDLAEKLNKSERMIQKYESGEVTPSVDILKKIAVVLGVDLSTLLKDSSYHDLTGMDETDRKTYLEMIAPVENYRKYIEIFETFDYRVIQHINNDVLIYDILLNDKVIATLDLKAFCTLSEKIIGVKQIFDKSLRLIINDEIKGLNLIYGLSGKDDSEI